MRHLWKRAKPGHGCTVDVDTDNNTPFGIACSARAVIVCESRHDEDGGQMCGEARCRKHRGRSGAATPTKGAK